MVKVNRECEGLKVGRRRKRAGLCETDEKGIDEVRAVPGTGGSVRGEIFGIHFRCKYKETKEWD